MLSRCYNTFVDNTSRFVTKNLCKPEITQSFVSKSCTHHRILHDKVTDATRNEVVHIGTANAFEYDLATESYW